jgi:hypothetical protein
MIENKNMIENKKDITLIDACSKIIDFLEKGDYESIHTLEHNISEIAIRDYNKDYSELCIVTYGLRKILSKEHIRNKEEWKDAQIEVEGNLKRAIKEFKMEDHSNFNNIIKNIQIVIAKTDKNLGNYVTHLIEDARVKLASNAYAYGLSANQSANLFSANLDELMMYIGITKMPDEDTKFKSIKERVNLLEVMKKSEKI